MLTPEGRARLEGVADTVWARKNVGFDVWAYKEALEAFGPDRLAEYDELILTNYTYFGPIYPLRGDVRPYGPAGDLDFWGLTEHKRIDENPLAAQGDTGPLEAHIQSHWIAVRKTMFTAMEFAAGTGSSMPTINSIPDSIRYHEVAIHRAFRRPRIPLRRRLPRRNYPSDNPVFDPSA